MSLARLLARRESWHPFIWRWRAAACVLLQFRCHYLHDKRVLGDSYHPDHAIKVKGITLLCFASPAEDGGAQTGWVGLVWSRLGWGIRSSRRSFFNTFACLLECGISQDEKGIHASKQASTQTLAERQADQHLGRGKPPRFMRIAWALRQCLPHLR